MGSSYPQDEEAKEEKSMLLSPQEYAARLKEQEDYRYNPEHALHKVGFVQDKILDAVMGMDMQELLYKPKVMEIIFRFYWAIYYILSDDLKEFEKETLALKSLRRQYTEFIHRDLTDLSFYISNNLSEIKKQKYEYISSILYKGE